MHMQATENQYSGAHINFIQHGFKLIQFLITKNNRK